MARPRFAAIVLCCLIGLATVAVVAGAPPPTTLCGSCADGVPGATEPGTLDVYVDGDGDSRWIERVPVNDSAADRYRENATALEREVDPTGTYYHVVGEGVDRTIALENGTVTVTYAVESVARTGVRDARVVDYFALENPRDRYWLEADRVTIHTPEGTVVTNDPSGATVDGNTATWDGESEFGDRTYVTYGSSDESALVGAASAYATIGLEIGPDALEQGVRAGLVPGALLAFAGIAAGRVDWGRDAFDLAALERLLVGVGAIGAVGLVVVSTAATGRPFNPALGALSALGVGYAALGIAVRRGRRRSTRGVIALAALVSLATGALLWVLGGPGSLTALPFGLAAACFLPLGYAAERRSSVVPLALAAFTAIFLIGGAVVLSLFVAPAGLGVFVFWFVLVGWAVMVAVFGYPLALVGRLLATDADPADGSM
ncbi:hypothetical protein [Halopiger xanaduensis]|uniref:Uncharacterized protein n=1 Tax=Halopiger xanaduensis (strain DSM 18323 / JCM 14033 / SH-6) TaxID=797210 RepID=F8DCT4_HALXS|nr:hypothetical protein [Halopiger xanaduensis]AEH37259.1 hypothetical protein Halxa_2642 [Halopiger xanaduensis SH-6]